MLADPPGTELVVRAPALQFGIVSTRIAATVLRDGQVAFPIEAYNAANGVTLSLPGVAER